MNHLSLIPLPQSTSSGFDRFTLTPDSVISADRPNRANAQYLRDRLTPATGYPFSIKHGHGDHGIQLQIKGDQSESGVESYHLAVTSDFIKIKAPTPRGIFYGIQTLLQLLPAELESGTPIPGFEWHIPGVEINDQPRFAWRGFMLDEGRHFHGKETILDLLDAMAALKLNIFHWHLTEDQGWRIQIQRYPRLTKVGAYRAGTAQSLLDMILDRHNGVPHGGYYTQDEISEIVSYAADRYITVIPEIEIPGHSTAALAAYPEFSCTGSPLEVPTRFGIFKDIYCAGKEETFIFLQNVLDEVMDLFPSPYIHIGGDEAPKTRWKQCPNCQQRMDDEALDDEHALQIYFTNRIAEYLSAYNRTIICWNQALSDHLNPDAHIQYWLGKRKDMLKAVRAGRKMINSSFQDMYLNQSYSLTPLSRVYEFDPVFKELNPSEAQNIVGLEAPLWTEFVPSRARLDYQTFPRLLAAAETAWTTKSRKDYTSFSRRLADYERRLDYNDIGYARGRAVEPPWIKRLFRLLTIAQPQRNIAD